MAPAELRVWPATINLAGRPTSESDRSGDSGSHQAEASDHQSAVVLLSQSGGGHCLLSHLLEHQALPAQGVASLQGYCLNGKLWKWFADAYLHVKK